eukprot:2660626-Amphidinium_carterae.1
MVPITRHKTSTTTRAKQALRNQETLSWRNIAPTGGDTSTWVKGGGGVKERSDGCDAELDVHRDLLGRQT